MKWDVDLDDDGEDGIIKDMVKMGSKSLVNSSGGGLINMKKNTDFNKKVFEYYMALYAVNDIRSTIITLVIGIADIFVLLPAFANPVQPIYMYIIVPPVAFLNVWAIWIVINPRKRQLQYTLFRGVFGIVCSVGLLVITQKFAYGMLGLQTPIYFVFSVGLYIFALNQYYKNHIRKLQGSIKKSKSSKKTLVSEYWLL